LLLILLLLRDPVALAGLHGVAEGILEREQMVLLFRRGQRSQFIHQERQQLSGRKICSYLQDFVMACGKRYVGWRAPVSKTRIFA
jgi:hypothetical protein